MSSACMIALLWLGPPTLPDLPAERAAKARIAEQARLEAEAKAEAEAREKRTPEPQTEADVADPEPPPVAPPPRGQGGPTTAAQGPSTPVTARQLRDVASPTQLSAASPAEVAAWTEDDAVYGAPGSVDDAGGAGDVPPDAHAPTRTAHRMRSATVLEAPAARVPPRRSAAFVFGYRIFQTHDAFARAQSWHVGSLEVTPVRRWVRFNLITEVGAEGGAAARDGDRADLFMMQKAGLGIQYPHWLSPFVEFQGGAGAARVELFDRNDLLLIWSLGVDAGAQWAVTRWMWIHAAVGWIRPTFQRPERAVYHDSFTFKIGVGF